MGCLRNPFADPFSGPMLLEGLPGAPYRQAFQLGVARRHQSDLGGPSDLESARFFSESRADMVPLGWVMEQRWVAIFSATYLRAPAGFRERLQALLVPKSHLGQGGLSGGAELAVTSIQARS